MPLAISIPDLDPDFTVSQRSPSFQSVSHQTGSLFCTPDEGRLAVPKSGYTEQSQFVASAPDAMSPDPSEHTFVTINCLRPTPAGPALRSPSPAFQLKPHPEESKLRNISLRSCRNSRRAHRSVFFQIGDFLFPNNLPANAHGNGYAIPTPDPHSVASVESRWAELSTGAEGNHAPSTLASRTACAIRILPLTQFTSDQHDADFVTGWSPSNPATLGWVMLQTSFGNGFFGRPEHRQQYKLNAIAPLNRSRTTFTLFGAGYYGTSFIPG